MWTGRFRLVDGIALALLAGSPADVVLAEEPAAGQTTYLHVIPVSVAGGLAAPDSPLRITLTPGTPEAIESDWPTALGASIVDGQIVFDLHGYPQLDGAVTEKHRTSTFVIDFHEPEVRELTEELVAAVEIPDLADLVRFTDQTISEKTMSRDWDLASRVARHREGDCTEHAVLLTALARSTGRPARVVVGVALVWIDGAIEAYGHAWAEIHDGTAWRLADASGVDREAAVRYIPLVAVTEEGPGYGLRLMGQLFTTWPKKIEIGPATESGVVSKG